MRIRHHSFFQTDIGQLDWDRLRDDQSEESYHVPFDRDTYLARMSSAPANPAVTDAIRAFASDKGLSSMLSIGTGIGFLEYQLRPDFERLIVSDITDSIERLASFGIYSEAWRFNVLEDPLPQSGIDLVLLPRIDTEFSDAEFRDAFRKLRYAGIRYVCLVPVGILDLSLALAELRVWMRALFTRRSPVFCGYFRDFHGLEKAWRGQYSVIAYDKAAPVIFLEAS